MSHFSADSDQPVFPDGLDLDPFEMDWPWPGVRIQQPDAPDAPHSPVSGSPAPAPGPLRP